MDIDKIDINILYFLYVNDKNSTLHSSQISEIQEYFTSGQQQIAYYTVVRRIQKLIQNEYVAEGFKNRNAKTYFILKKGIDFIENNIGDEIIYINSETTN